MKQFIRSICIIALAATALAVSALAVDEAALESAVENAGAEKATGNVLLWFLCAIAFLKISQKIDSFMSAIGINVGKTGGNMLAELLIAGRSLAVVSGAAGAGAAGIFGSVFGKKGATAASAGNAGAQAAGKTFSGTSGGIIGMTKRAVGKKATAAATDRSEGLGGVVGSAIFNNSLHRGGKLAASVVSAVATGNYASVGSIQGEKASEALTSYLGYDNVSADSIDGKSAKAQDINADTKNAAQSRNAQSVPEPIGVGKNNAQNSMPGSKSESSSTNTMASVVDPSNAEQGAAAQTSTGGIPTSPDGQQADTAASRFEHGGEATGQENGSTINAPADAVTSSIPTAPTFRDVEIGGGRITGYETPAGGGEERQFAMYNASQYMKPEGKHEVVETTDGEKWYKQYAQPTVEKTPQRLKNGKIGYSEQIVDRMPQIPKRKDRI